MTQNREKDIREMVSNIYPTFDGIVALVAEPSLDSTRQILEENKGAGKILSQKWTNNHGFLMNHILFYGGIKEDDICVWLDSPEKATEKFLELVCKIKNNFFSKNLFGALYWDGRPYIFRHNQYLSFTNAVHWGISNLEGEIFTIPDKDKYIINKRKENPNVSWLINPIKYFICYPLGNEVECMYSKYSKEIVYAKEIERKEFRKHCQKILKLNLDNLDDLIQYMKELQEGIQQASPYFLDFCDNCFRMTDLFRHKLLEQNLIPDIVKNRFNWRLSVYLKNQDLNQLDNGHTGEINKLNLQFGFPQE